MAQRWCGQQRHDDDAECGQGDERMVALAVRNRREEMGHRLGLKGYARV
jgi:hypothetical protein